MLLGDPSNPASPSFSAPAPATHRSYIPSLIPPGVDPAKVDSKMFYTYVPNTIKTRKRTTPAQLEILEGVFVTDKKPNAPRRKELAKKLKMSPREVQVRALRPVSSSRPLKKLSFRSLLPPLAKRYGSKTGVLRRKSRSQKRTFHLPPLPPRLPSPPLPPPRLPSPLMCLPPPILPRMPLLIRFHYPVHPPSPRSSLRRPSRLHAHLRVLHGNLHLSLRPPPTTRLISCNNTMLPPLVLLPGPALPCMVFVVAPFLFSASSPRKSTRRQSRCRLHISHHMCRRSPLHTNTTTFPLHSLLRLCHLTCCTTAVRLVRFRDIPMPCPSVVLLLKQITHHPLARPRVYRRRTRHRTCVPPYRRVWICPASSLQVALQTLVVMDRNRTTRHDFIHSNRSHGVRTSRIAHRCQPCSMYPTMPTLSTYQLPRCPCQHSPLHRPVPSLSRRSSSAKCLVPHNSRMGLCGTTRIRLAPVRQMQGIRLVCRLLYRLRLGCQQVAMSSPNANPL
jgi:hypothetical protein